MLVRFDNVEQALRKVKKYAQLEGIFRVLRLKREYRKPSVARALKQEEAVKRRSKLARRGDRM